jgi:hypothetical protein
LRSNWVIHLPHASTIIPATVRPELLLSDQDLAIELLRMTDHLTDDLIAAALPPAQRVCFPVSRTDYRHPASDWTEMRHPQGNHPGEIAEGFYIVADGRVHLSDEKGVAIGRIFGRCRRRPDCRSSAAATRQGYA